MRELGELFSALSRSRFRSQFHLNGKDSQYLTSKGLETVLLHAGDFVDKRLAPAMIANDGKQTPFKGHPVFVAQHATACCCRGCLHKWHGIAVGRKLTYSESAYIVSVLERWLLQELQRISGF